MFSVDYADAMVVAWNTLVSQHLLLWLVGGSISFIRHVACSVAKLAEFAQPTEDSIAAQARAIGFSMMGFAVDFLLSIASCFILVLSTRVGCHLIDKLLRRRHLSVGGFENLSHRKGILLRISCPYFFALMQKSNKKPQDLRKTPDRRSWLLRRISRRSAVVSNWTNVLSALSVYSPHSPLYAPTLVDLFRRFSKVGPFALEHVFNFLPWWKKIKTRAIYPCTTAEATVAQPLNRSIGGAGRGLRRLDFFLPLQCQDKKGKEKTSEKIAFHAVVMEESSAPIALPYFFALMQKSNKKPQDLRKTPDRRSWLLRRISRRSAVVSNWTNVLSALSVYSPHSPLYAPTLVDLFRRFSKVGPFALEHVFNFLPWWKKIKTRAIYPCTTAEATVAQPLNRSIDGAGRDLRRSGLFPYKPTKHSPFCVKTKREKKKHKRESPFMRSWWKNVLPLGVGQACGMQRRTPPSPYI